MLRTMYLNIKTYFRETNYFNAKRPIGFDEEKGLKLYKHSLHPVKSPEDIIVDKSLGYFRHPGAPCRIKSYSPNSEFIFIVFDPVKRSGSDFSHMVVMGKRKKYREL